MTRILPPPDWWNPNLTGDESRMAVWSFVGAQRRMNVKTQHAKLANMLSVLGAKVEAGTATRREQLFVARGGLSYRDEADRGRAAISRRARNNQNSDYLNFKKTHATGCSVEGCALQPSANPMISLMDHDHRDPSTKVDNVTRMTGEERAAEVAKTDCTCLWHHFLHTREQKGYQPIGKSRILKPMHQVLLEWKEYTGCEHPLHASMPYATLVPSAAEDPLMYGFLQISHVERPFRACYKKVERNDQLRDLKSGAAVVHCYFCHRLYTMCERSKLTGGLHSASEYATLLRQSPAFIQHFEESTTNVDWVAMRAKTHENMSKAATERNLARKRKRDSEQ